MIGALTQWLERIILLVLLATFLDMILPNSSTQRYVKLVMGLLILLSILTPVMSIFQKNFTEDKLALKILNFQSGPSSDEDLKRIKEYGEKLMMENDQDTQLFVKKQMESLIKTKVEEKFGIGVQEVHVTVSQKETDKKQSYPVISAVQLILDKDNKLSVSGSSTQATEIKPIKPVTINVGGDSSQVAPAVSTPSNLSSEQRKMLTDVVQFVAQTWSIDQTQVVANLERKAGEG